MIFSFPEVEYESDPFPHCVVRGAWDEQLLRNCKADCRFNVKWDGPKDDPPKTLHKWRCDKWDLVPAGIEDYDEEFHPSTRELIQFAHEPPFIEWLERTTGENGLVPDPHLFGGGLHRISRGGYLSMHRDFNLHPKLGLYRRLNLLLYLNPDWQSGWGGNLILGKTARSIPPDRNTMVVFTTDDDSWHGHPAPLACPENVYRDSIALYYYSAIKPDNARTTTDYDA